MTKIKCNLTGCKYNASCCSSPSDNVDCFCTLENVHLDCDEGFLECKMFCDTLKEVECDKCQLSKYGGIKLGINFKEIVIEQPNY